MTYKATIVELPDVNLAVNRADRFPEGIEAAWKDLESKLTSLKGRRFYGLAVCEGDELAYYAGVETSDDEEIAKLGLPTMKIKRGRYARAKLYDWRDQKDEIGKIFDQLMQDHDMDPDGACIEFYRSEFELHLLIPLAKLSE